MRTFAMMVGHVMSGKCNASLKISADEPSQQNGIVENKHGNVELYAEKYTDDSFLL